MWQTKNVFNVFSRGKFNNRRTYKFYRSRYCECFFQELIRTFHTTRPHMSSVRGLTSAMLILSKRNWRNFLVRPLAKSNQRRNLGEELWEIWIKETLRRIDPSNLPWIRNPHRSLVGSEKVVKVRIISLASPVTVFYHFWNLKMRIFWMLSAFSN